MNRRSLVILLLLLAELSYGGIGKYRSSALQLNSVSTGSLPVNVCAVDDGEYAYMTSQPVPYAFINHHIKDYVSLEYTGSQTKGYSEWFVTVNFTLLKWDTTGTQMPSQSGSVMLHYNPAKGAVESYRADYESDWGDSTVVQITGITYSNPSGQTPVMPDDIELTNRIEVDRYWKMDQSSGNVPVLTAGTGAGNVLNLAWSYLPGAESYDLEWEFVSGYVPSPYNTPDFTQATRVNTSSQNYSINLTFDVGTLYYHVRGVGYMSPGSTVRKESYWSQVGSVQIGDMDLNHNWTYAAAYAEQGKRREVLTFFDGSTRQRQAITENNSQNVALVSETMYDYEGREAVSTLPAADNQDDAQLLFYPGFNLEEGSSTTPYSKKDFDVETSADCPLPSTPPGIAALNGAGNYYSQLNPLRQMGLNAAIPDAGTSPYTLAGGGSNGTYPFSQTEYGLDGKVMEQSGPGTVLNEGSGHTTLYFYGTPLQSDLDKLFGSEESADATHFQEKLVQDPNGSVSVSYSNLSGKVVAASLIAPGSPLHVQALNENNNSIQSYSSVVGPNNFDSPLDQTEINSDYICKSTGLASFTYTIDPGQLNVCLPKTFTGVYDLIISVTDGCNNIVPIIPGTLPTGVTLNSSNELVATAFSNSLTISFNVNFPTIGSYHIHKVLSLDAEGLRMVQKAYNDSFPGMCGYTTLSQYQTNYTNSINTTNCMTCSASCQAEAERMYPGNLPAQQAHIDSCNCGANDTPSPCTALYNAMINDMSPGGQYFDDRQASAASSQPFSDSWLIANVGGGSSTTVVSGFTAWLATPGNTCSSTATFSTIEDIRDNWQTCFADYFITFHPEYCRYRACTTLTTPVSPSVNSTSFDQTMAGITSYSVATGSPYNYTSGTAVLNADPFFNGGGPGSSPTSYYTVMENQINSYVPPVAPTSGTPPCLPGTMSMWDYAVCQVTNNPAPTSTVSIPDQEWLAFTGLYQQEKQTLVEQWENSSTPTNCESFCDQGMINNGTPDDIAAQGGTGCSTPNSAVGFFIRDPSYAQSLTAEATTYVNSGGTAPNPNTSEYTVNCNTPASAVVTQDITAGSGTPTNASGSFTDNQGLGGSGTGRITLTFSDGNVATTGVISLSPLSGVYQAIVNAVMSQTPYTAVYNGGLNLTITAPAGTQYNGVKITSSSTAVTSPFDYSLYPDPLTLRGASDGGTTTLDVTNCSVNPAIDLTPGGITISVGEPLGSVYQAIALAINNSPAGYSAVVDLGVPSLTINAPQSAGTSANGTQLCFTESGALNATGSVTMSGGVTVPCVSSTSLPNCLCTYISQLAAQYQTAGSTQTEEDYIAGLLNTAYGTSVTDAQIDTWMANCAQIGEPMPVTDPTSAPLSSDPNAVPTALNCNPEPPCLADATNITNYYSQVSYEQELQQQIMNFMGNYETACFSTADGYSESMTVSSNSEEYHYTLYYYDQAGNLTRTVPPAGVDILSPTDVQNIQNHRLATTDPNYYPTPTYPSHTKVSDYQYNTLNELVIDSTPDDREIKHYYDAAGRIRFTQNAQQAVSSPGLHIIGYEANYSYNNYDALGRTIEVGQSDDIYAIGQSFVYGLDDETFPHNTAQVTHTYYDAVNTALFTAVQGQFDNGGQQNLRALVASVTYSAAGSANTNNPPYDNATHYSYDEHGNVSNLVQENDDLAFIGEQYKKIRYDFDLVSENVNEVYYQPCQPDQYIHKYDYDADNRLTNAYTSVDGVIWDQDEKEFYYLHGPLARKELGQDKVHGCDYAYTIEGALKGVNSNIATEPTDIGQDGMSATSTSYLPGEAGIHSNIAIDAYGFTLSYFNGDYSAVNTNLNTPGTSFYNNGQINNPNEDLFNGSIKQADVALTDNNNNPLPLMDHHYQYDQLNRLLNDGPNMYAGIYNTTTAHGNIPLASFYNYDPDGNMMGLTRNANNSGSGAYDDLQYTYTTNTNQLASVDEVSSVSGSGLPRGVSNYTYDNIGELTSDVNSNISNITWSVYGKTLSISGQGTQSQPDIYFNYDANGNRIEKIIEPRSGGVLSTPNGWLYTYYINDASGNIMATYNLVYSGTTLGEAIFSMEENPIYGSGRIGDFSRNSAQSELEYVNYSGISASANNYDATLNGASSPQAATTPSTNYSRNEGYKSYELTDHLGNVLMTISDRKLPNVTTVNTVVNYFTADIDNATDYYPFGEVMPGRQFGSTNYRFGYNGMEKTDDVYGLGNEYTTEFRQYNPRLARWMSVDPKEMSWESPYVAFDDNPILFDDPFGDIVKYAKFGDRVRVTFGRIFSKKVRDKFRVFKAADFTYTYRLKPGSASLKDAVESSGFDNIKDMLTQQGRDNYYVDYSSEGFEIDAKRKVTIARDNKRGYKNNTDITLNRIVPNTPITFKPYAVPDEFTLTTPNGTQVYNTSIAQTWSNHKTAVAQAPNGFGAVLNAKSDQYNTKPGNNTLILRVRSWAINRNNPNDPLNNGWPYIEKDANGNNTNIYDTTPDLYWEVTYWKYIFDIKF